jgi:4-hydroxythreonine-4-phosphate dehydrogenase
MGDVAGIGPEIIARAWPHLQEMCRPIVVGVPDWLEQALRLTGTPGAVQRIGRVEEAGPGRIPCLAATTQDLTTVQPGRVSAAAGRAAYDFLCRAIDETLAGRADGIVTAPLHKAGLHAAGVAHPGHTEILAERTGTRHFGMMLYARGPRLPRGLGVVHVTLHMALRDVFRHLSTDAVLEKIRLLDTIMRRLAQRRPQLALAALNPHAGDGGLFGDEEARLLLPALAAARAEGIEVTGPWPSDTLFVRATHGDFDGVVALYHDQGHIPLKLLGGLHAVNITVGLPLVRTSVAHGTAYDIVGKGVADAASMIEAARVAARLCARGESASESDPEPGASAPGAGPGEIARSARNAQTTRA